MSAEKYSDAMLLEWLRLSDRGLSSAAIGARHGVTGSAVRNQLSLIRRDLALSDRAAPVGFTGGREAENG